MYYLFNPERSAWWRQNSHGYTTDKHLAGVFSKKMIGERGYPITDRDSVNAMLQANRSFAVPVHNADLVSFLERQTENSDPNLFV